MAFQKICYLIKQKGIRSTAKRSNLYVVYTIISLSAPLSSLNNSIHIRPLRKHISILHVKIVIQPNNIITYNTNTKRRNNITKFVLNQRIRMIRSCSQKNNRDIILFCIFIELFSLILHIFFISALCLQCYFDCIFYLRRRIF